MRLAPFIPVCVLGVVLYLGTRGIREKLASAMGLGYRLKAQKQLVFIRQRIERKTNGKVELSVLSPEGRLVWLNRWVVDPEGKRADMSRDPWGSPLRFEVVGVRMYLVSAGSDKRFGTSDDLKELMILDE